MLIKLLLGPLTFALGGILDLIPAIPQMDQSLIYIFSLINQVSYFLPMDAIGLAVSNILWWLGFQLATSLVLFIYSLLPVIGRNR